jgi:subtilisin family serine protease
MRFCRQFATVLGLFGLVVAAAEADKKKTTRAADLPVFQYTIQGSVEDLVQSPEKFQSLASQIRRDVESVLRDYDIEDAATKRGLLSVLVTLDMLDGKDDAALAKLDEVRALEEKPSAKAISGLVTRSIITADKAAGSANRDRSTPEYRRAVYDALTKSLADLPYAVVQNDLKGLKGSLEITSRSLVIGQIQGSIDPVVKKSGSLSSDIANQLPMMRFLLTTRIPLAPVMDEALSTYLTAHEQAKPDIWAARNVTLPRGKHTPVRVAVWDSGVDVKIFDAQVVKEGDSKPALIAYGLDAKPEEGYLFHLTPEQKAQFPAATADLKGFMDLQANVDSKESEALRKELSAMQPKDAQKFLESISLYAIYSHGTHVAGILMAGNPYAQLVTGRISFDYKMIPDPCPSDELNEREVEATQKYVDFFKANGVRVVNMSWGGTAKGEEDGLEKCGIGKTAEERREIAAKYFAREKETLQKAIASAPDILFIAAAGNSNGSTSFEDSIPSGLKLANLVAVGAVDKAGDETSFTSYGPTVLLHANGFEVESDIPGGGRLKMSGTSMASPNAANLAAKILAVNPKLTPPEVIAIMRETSTTTPDGRRFLIDPKKALAKAGQTQVSAR